MDTIPSTIERRLPENYELVDLSLRGETREWWTDMQNSGLIEHIPGVDFISNTNSPIVLMAPHARQGLTAFDTNKVSRDALLVANANPWEVNYPDTEGKVPRIGKAVVYLDENGKYMPSKPKSKEGTGFGDSLSMQLTLEIAQAISNSKKDTSGDLRSTLPNVAISQMSQASFDNNAGSNPAELGSLQEVLRQINEADPIEGYQFANEINALKFIDDPDKLNALRSNIFKNIGNLTERTAETLARFKNAALLSVKTMWNYRRTVVNLTTGQANPQKEALILNVHTALDRNPKKGGNPEVELIIGSRRGLSSNPEVELAFALHLKDKGFGVIDTSLFPPSSLSDDEIDPETGVKPKQAIDGEVDSQMAFSTYAKSIGIEPDTFKRDTTLEQYGRLAGTEIMPKLRAIIFESNKVSNLIQIEVVRGLLANDERRLKLAEAIAEFCNKFEANF